MRLRTGDGGLGAPQVPLGFCASSPILDLGEPANVIKNVNEDKSNTSAVALSQLEHDLSSPSHLRITINTQDKKIEIEQVKVTLVYKGRGELDLNTTEESSFKTQLPQITEFNIKNVTVDGVGGTERFPENNETADNNVKVFEAAEVVDVSNILDKSQVEGRIDADDKEKMKDVDAKKSEADDVAELLRREIENLSIKDPDENDENLEEISLDGISLPAEEDKELFNRPSLLLVFDYGLGDWIVKEFGILLLYQRGNKYQLQFRKYHNDVRAYQTTLTMDLKASFKLHQMRYSHSNAWEWTFHYITEEGAGAFRTLAVKFLSQQEASEFNEQIKKCVLALKGRGGTPEANLDVGFVTPRQSLRLIPRTPTPTLGPGTVLRSRSADICERPAHRIGSYWTSPISSKSRKIRRNSSNNETGSTPEDYRLKRLCITPPLNDQNNSTEETKVSVVYKCHACGLCFDRPEILLDIHLNKCSPDMKLVKTKCACGLVFDQYNFTYHCQVHRQYTALNVKKIVVRDEKNLDVSGMKEVFMEEMGDYETTGESSVRNDESNATIATNKCEMEAKVANKKVTTNVSAVQKVHRVYVCQCRLCFDRAEFFIKHLSKCSLETKVVQTTCICDLVFDKYNFAYHCEVHRQVTVLNVKYIVVRDEGFLDISRMKQEFVEDDEINVTENMKVAFMKTLDQSLIYKPVPKYNVTQNAIEKKICTGEEYNNAENEDKATCVITDNVTENQTTLNEVYNSNEEFIGFQENKTDGRPCNASKELIESTESIDKEKFEIPNNSEVHDELTKKNYPDLGPSHIAQTVGKTILPTEEQQRRNSDTDAVVPEKKIKKIPAEDENHGNIPTRENSVTIKTDTEKMGNMPNNSEPHSETIKGSDLVNHEKALDSMKLMTGETINISTVKEKPHCHSDSDAIDSGKKTNNTVGQILVKDSNHVDENITKENKMEEPTVGLQKETDISSESNIEHDPKSKENETPDLTPNSQYIKEAIQVPDGNGNETNDDQTDDISNAQENETGEKGQKARVTRENSVTIKTDTEKMGNVPNNSEPHSETVKGSNLVNNEKDPDSIKLMTGETINISTIKEKPHCHSDSDAIDSGKKTNNIVDQILVKDSNHVDENIIKENKMKETTVGLQKETDILAESKVERDPKSKENETPDLTPNSQYIKEAIQVPDGNETNDSQTDDISNAQENETVESQKANVTRESNITIETDNEKIGNMPNNSEPHSETSKLSDFVNNEKDPDSLKLMTGESNNISTIEEKPQCHRDRDRDISSESKVEHDPKSKENETLDLTPNSQYIKEAIQVPDGNETNDGQIDDISNVQENEIGEKMKLVRVSVERDTKKMGNMPDNSERHSETIKGSDLVNNEKKRNSQYTKEIIKTADGNEKSGNQNDDINNAQEDETGEIKIQSSNTGNSNQKKPGKQAEDSE